MCDQAIMTCLELMFLSHNTSIAFCLCVIHKCKGDWYRAHEFILAGRDSVRGLGAHPTVDFDQSLAVHTVSLRLLLSYLVPLQYVYERLSTGLVECTRLGNVRCIGDMSMLLMFEVSRRSIWFQNVVASHLYHRPSLRRFYTLPSTHDV